MILVSADFKPPPAEENNTDTTPATPPETQVYDNNIDKLGQIVFSVSKPVSDEDLDVTHPGSDVGGLRYSLSVGK